MKKTIIKIAMMAIILILQVLAIHPAAVKSVPLPDVLKPSSLAADHSRIYIGDGPSVRMYDRKTHKFIKCFGKNGEGPGEFMVYPGFGVDVFVQQEALFITSVNRVSYFTKEGGFIKEKRTPVRPIYPLGKGYAGYNETQDKNTAYFVLNLYDSQLQKTGEVTKWEHPLQFQKKEMHLVPLPTDAVSFKDRLYVAPGADFVIDVYDARGKKLHSIRLDYQRVKVTGAYKKRVDEFFKTDLRYRKQYQNLKPMFRFPDYFPAIKRFFVDGGKIYVQTYEEKNGMNRFYIFSIEGKFRKTVELPYKDRQGMNILPLYTVSGGRFYQLVENAEMETWELQTVEI